MGDVIVRKILLYCATAMSCVLLLMAVFCAVFFSMSREKYDEKQMRIDFNTLTFNVQESYESSAYDKIETELPYAVADLGGNILFSTSAQYSAGDTIDLHTLASSGTDLLRYVIPVTHHGEQFGTLMIFPEKEQYRILPYPWVGALGISFLLCATVMVCFIGGARTMKKDMLVPLKQLQNTAKNILDGNFSASVQYDYDGEVGLLCHDFEMLRSELEESKKREESMQTQEKLLLACISHDLKTPIAAVSGYAEGILYGVVQDKESIKRYAEIILNKATVLNCLIDDILEHSKLQLNQLSIVREEVYSEAFFSELFEEAAFDAAQSGFSFEFSYIPNVLLEIDRKRIAQVIGNLVGNAIKYGNPNGKIRVEVMLCESPESALVISIQDDGIGIAAADLPFIFDKFYRSDKARTQSVAGMGLGLTITKYIIEQHGGRIECDSVFGQGTTFSFSLPVI